DHERLEPHLDARLDRDPRDRAGRAAAVPGGARRRCRTSARARRWVVSAVAVDLARGLDPVALAREIGMEPDDWQIAVLRSRAQRILLNVTRQGGKTVVSALVALWTCLYEPGSLVLVISASERKAIELFRVE